MSSAHRYIRPQTRPHLPRRTWRPGTSDRRLGATARARCGCTTAAWCASAAWMRITTPPTATPPIRHRQAPPGRRRRGDRPPPRGGRRGRHARPQPDGAEAVVRLSLRAALPRRRRARGADERAGVGPAAGRSPPHGDGAHARLSTQASAHGSEDRPLRAGGNPVWTRVIWI